MTVRDYIQARPKLRYWASVRWPIADLLNRSPRHCWSNLVDWALGWSQDSSPFVGGGDSCRAESLIHRDACCYCGKFKGGVEWREAHPTRLAAAVRALRRLLRPTRCPLCRARTPGGGYCPEHTDVEITQYEESRP